jgi:hypothetical protein
MMNFDQLLNMVLFEGKCPHCGQNGAYIGLNKIDCPNQMCPSNSSNPLKPKRVNRNLMDKYGDIGISVLTLNDGISILVYTEQHATLLKNKKVVETVFQNTLKHDKEHDNNTAPNEILPDNLVKVIYRFAHLGTNVTKQDIDEIYDIALNS